MATATSLASLFDHVRMAFATLMPVCRRLVRWGVLAVALALPQVGTADDALDWLERMSMAVRDLNYRGTFVYVHNGQLEAMYIAHRGGRDSRQRLFALNGAAREVLRDEEGVTCILPDSKAVMVDRGLPQTPFADLPPDLSKLHQHYQFRLDDIDRVSRRSARMVVILPRDDYRYGYRFWLDTRYALPLRTELVTPGGKPLEQMMFTQIEVVTELDDEELQPALSGEEFARYEGEFDATGVEKPAGEDSSWRFAWIPPGFELRDHNWHGMPVGKEKVEHWVFSDGLATVSVYIETLKGDAGPKGLQGLSSMGAVNAMGRTLDRYHITVVGEVPRVTVERLALGIERR